MSMSSHQTLLAEIAVRAMRENGFVPEPPPDALAEVARCSGPDAAGAGGGGGAGAGASLPDLRGLPWSSIDNPESRDLDQIEAVEKVDGGVRLLVGIADVDRFVPSGSATDHFAGANTISVYTAPRVFTMLPERLSFDLSSLVPGQPRWAMVLETLVRPDGTVGDGRVYAALVENHAQLNYPSVSAWLDGQAAAPAPLANAPTLRAQLELQAEVAHQLAGARRRAGALDVDTHETRAVLDEHGHVQSLVAHVQDRAGRIIEELMIASNRTVARALDSAGLPSIRRVVREPERWERIVAYAGEHGHRLPPEPSSVELAKFVDKMREKHSPEEFAEISVSIVKMMGRGEYVAHMPGEKEIGHFGLATAEYVHATAPNRRYPDVIGQRLLKARDGGRARPPYDREALMAIAARCSEREAQAQKVERRVHKSAAALLLAPRVGERFSGIVSGAGAKGVWVRVFAPPVEGKIIRGGEDLEVGAKVRVRLQDVNVEMGFIDFTVVHG